MNQCEQIKDFIERNGSITTMEAYDALGITKLTTRISEMREAGIGIVGVRESGKNRFGKRVSYNRYTIKSDSAD